MTHLFQILLLILHDEELIILPQALSFSIHAFKINNVEYYV